VAPYTFFTSYADNVAYRDLLETFHTDLANELAIRAGRAVERHGFLARRDIPVGSAWEPALQDAACTTLVMVALLSDDYFRSHWCGWEWAVFTERIRRATPTGGRAPRAILPVTWVPLRAAVPSVASALQLTSATLGPAYAGSCVVDLMRQRPGEYQGVVIALAEEVLRAASPPLPPLDLSTAAALPPAFDLAVAGAGAAVSAPAEKEEAAAPAAGTPSPDSPASGAAAPSSSSSPTPGSPPAAEPATTTPATDGATSAHPSAAARATTAASAGARMPSGPPPGRFSSKDLLELVEALERVEFLHDPWTRRMWVTEIGESSGRVPRLPETPYLRSYFISLVRFASRQPSSDVLNALANALDLFDPGADGVSDVHAIVGRLRW
jgi:hypothetical protein